MTAAGTRTFTCADPMTTIRPIPPGLPQQAQDLLEGIRSYRILGGSRVSRAMLDAFTSVAEASPSPAPE